MALPFPNVPDVPGVPQLPRSPGEAISDLTALATQNQGPLWNSASQDPVWGVFLFTEVDDPNDPAYPGSYNAVLTPDSILSLDNTNEWSVSNFPVQGGQIATYNKVLLPFEVSLTMTITGSVTDRTNFLKAVESIAPDTNLYTIITPEYTYKNCNVTRFSNPRHGPANANRLEIDIFFIQIVPVTAQYSTTQTSSPGLSPYIALPNAQDPTAQPLWTLGNINPQPVPAQTQSAAGVSLDYYDNPAG
jgi:hypothetical protein